MTIRPERTGEEAIGHSTFPEQAQGSPDQRWRRARRLQAITGGGELEVQYTLEQDRQEAVLSRFRRSSSAWRFVVSIHGLDSLW